MPQKHMPGEYLHLTFNNQCFNDIPSDIVTFVWNEIQSLS